MKMFLIAVSAALLCSQAESSYLGVAQGTPLGGFSQHRSFHDGFIPSGLHGNDVPAVNHEPSGGHLPGPIYRNEIGRLDNPYSGLRNVRSDGIDEAEDDRSSTFGSESVLSGTDFVSSSQSLGSIQTGDSGLPSTPVAAFGNFPFTLAHSSFDSGLPSAVGPYTSIAGLSGFPYGVHPHTSTLGTYPYGLGSLSPISGLAGFSYGAGAHASVAGLGGFPFDITHDASVAALSQQYGFLPNVGPHIPVGAVGGFPYGLKPHTPFSGLNGFPYDPELDTSFGGLGGFHSGLAPYAPVAGLGGLYATGPRVGRYSPGRGLHTPSAALKTHHSGFGSRHSSNGSSANKNANDKKGAKN